MSKKCDTTVIIGNTEMFPMTPVVTHFFLLIVIYQR